MTTVHTSEWALVSQVEGPGVKAQNWALNDAPVFHSWIIGAAVVNAFYSPNRNQIGTFPLHPAPLVLPSRLLSLGFLLCKMRGS